MKAIVLYNGACIYIPKYNITITDSEDDDFVVCLYVGDKLITSTGYCCSEDRQNTMDNIVAGLKDAGYEMMFI